MNKNGKGHSLVELIATIGILAVLAVVSISSYQQNTLQTNRAEAGAQMLMIQSVYESYYSQNNTYPTAGTLPPAGTIPSTTHYNYTTIINGTGYQIQATAINNQVGDTGCTLLTMDNLGNQTPTSCAPF